MREDTDIVNNEVIDEKDDYLKGNEGWLKLHNHKIWQRENGKWSTYVLSGHDYRKRIERETKEELCKALADYYKDVKPGSERFKNLFSEYKEINVYGIKPATYMISAKGDIYSIPSRKWRKFQISDQTKTYRGLYRVMLMTTSGEEKRFSVAKLTLTMFKGFAPEDMIDPTVDHINGDSLDNNIDNLRWLERDVNTATRKNRGIGERNGRAILTHEDVIAICNKLIKHELTIDAAAKLYNVSRGAIQSIVDHKNWKYISDYFDFAGVI